MYYPREGKIADAILSLSRRICQGVLQSRVAHCSMVTGAIQNSSIIPENGDISDTARSVVNHCAWRL